MARKDILGRQGEDLAAAYLVAHGYRILARNWRCPEGEVDVIARHEGTVVIVEVKTRTSLSYGHPLEAITAGKLARLRRLAACWCRSQETQGPVRIDGIGILFPPDGPARVEHVEGVYR
jgi:putative endonuclease